MSKKIDFEIGLRDTGAKKGFDGIDVSVKDLKERIADLDMRMKKLTDTYGRAGAELKAYDIMQRERASTLSQLISFEEKEAEAAKRSTRGMGSLASATMAATGSISGLGTGVSTLTYALMSGAGLTAGLAAAVAGFSLLMNYIRTTKEEAEKLKGLISSSLKVQGPGGMFEVDPKNLPGMIDALQKKIDAYNKAPTTSEGTKGSFTFEDIKTEEALLAVLKDQNNIYLSQQSILQAIRNTGAKWVKDKSKETKSLEEQVGLYKEMGMAIDNLILKTKNADIMQLSDYTSGSDFARITMQQQTGRGLPSASARNNAVRQREAELKNYQEILKERQRMENHFIRSTANMMRYEFMGVWEDVFGEANSLFEKLLANWASQFAGNAFSSLISLIPGVGSFAIY